MARRFTVGTTETNLPPHYFLGKAAKGFPGKHFLEEGLVAGVNAARIRLADLIQVGIRSLPQASVQRFGQFRGAGIGFNVVENVSQLEKLDIPRMLRRAFTEAIPIAKRESDSVFKSSLTGEEGKPITAKGRRASTISSYKFETYSTPNGVGLRPTGRGGAKNIAKVRALNFGLKTSFSDYQEESDPDEE